MKFMTKEAAEAAEKIATSRWRDILHNRGMDPARAHEIGRHMPNQTSALLRETQRAEAPAARALRGDPNELARHLHNARGSQLDTGRAAMADHQRNNPNPAPPSFLGNTLLQGLQAEKADGVYRGAPLPRNTPGWDTHSPLQGNLLANYARLRG